MTKQDQYFTNSIIFLVISILCQIQIFFLNITDLLFVSLASLLASWYSLNRAKKLLRTEFLELDELIDRRKGSSHFWLVMLLFWVITVIIALSDRNRRFAIIVFTIGGIFLVLYMIEKNFEKKRKKNRKEGKYANRNK